MPTAICVYTYGDSVWGDLLTHYDGIYRTYDDIGNLLNDGTWHYTWQNGRELASMTKGTTTWSYTYDANGMRTSRSNGTTTYNYVYNGSQLTQMTVGNDTLYFTYGILGPTTITWNGTTYYYALNAQGDVIGIFDGSGTLVVTYNWDNAWGYNPIPEGIMATTLGALNPLRYRGYVYDTDTGYYYLQSRYYDPEIGRFINADAFPSTGQGALGNNMFAYCLNNPVSFADRSGNNAEAAGWWASTMWWLCGIDTVLPVGDIIYGAGILILGVCALTVADDIATPQVSLEEDKKETEIEPPDVTYPGDDPAKAPDGYEWRGPDKQGGKRGGYANPNGKDSWHPDLDHPDGIKPHWDYNDGLKHRWRVYPTHIELVI